MRRPGNRVITSTRRVNVHSRRIFTAKEKNVKKMWEGFFPAENVGANRSIGARESGVQGKPSEHSEATNQCLPYNNIGGKPLEKMMWTREQVLL